MENILLVSTLTLALFARRIYAGGSDVINCAGCFAQKWNWAVSVQLLSNQTLNANQPTRCNQANFFWKFEIDLPCELLYERRIVPDQGKAEAESH